MQMKAIHAGLRFRQKWFRAKRSWYNAVERVILFGMWFVTLPSLDKSVKHPGGIIVHPSRGTPGSTFQTEDGQWYVRTRRGIRKVSGEAGLQLKKRQRVIRSAGIAARAVVAAMGVATIVAVIAFAVLAASARASLVHLAN